MCRPRHLRLLIALIVCSVPLAFARAQSRVHLQPRFVQGATLHYRIETSTSSNEHNITPVVNPEGASEYKQSTSLVLRLDVLDTQTAVGSSKVTASFRATFEQASSDSQADAYAPSADAQDRVVGKLKGKSFEFSVDTANQLSGIEGLTQIAPDRDVAARVVSWLHVLFAPVDLPAGGIVAGQKWTNEREMTDLPLTGLTWQNRSSYVRNESCAASSGVKSVGLGPGAQCAVLLTQFTILRRGSDRADRTPEAYLRNGLRTSGTWTGSGESLDAISLSTGLLVSSSQSATQDMDYEIRSAASGSSIRHVGRTTTKTEITLLPGAML